MQATKASDFILPIEEALPPEPVPLIEPVLELVIPVVTRPGNRIQRTLHRLRFALLAWLLQPLGQLTWQDGMPTLRFHETTHLTSNKHLLVSANIETPDPAAPPTSAHDNYSVIVNQTKWRR